MRVHVTAWIKLVFETKRSMRLRNQKVGEHITCYLMCCLFAFIQTHTCTA